MRRIPLIRAIGFDLDDTLFERYDTYHNVFQAMQEDHVPLEVPFEDFNPVYQRYSEDEFFKFMAGEKSKLDYKRDRVIRTYRHFDKSISADTAMAFEHLYQTLRQKIQFVDGAAELLQWVHEQGLIPFILTNGPSKDQRAKIQYLQLEQYVNPKHLFISDELECSKPDPMIFQKIEQQLNLKPDEILYIGDSWPNDVDGSTQSGWEAIWYTHNPKGDYPYQAKNYQEIKACIEQILGA